MHKLILLSIDNGVLDGERKRERRKSRGNGEKRARMCVYAWRATACICIVHAAG